MIRVDINPMIMDVDRTLYGHLRCQPVFGSPSSIRCTGLCARLSSKGDDDGRAEPASGGWLALCAGGWTARVRLASIEARAHARLRDQRATENALARAKQAREEVRGTDDPGGMLTFPLAKQSFYTATARLWLGGQDSYIAAERDAVHAVEL